MLEEYNKKRNFGQTSEPRGNKKDLTEHKSNRFVVQKHDATKLHYDFRLEDMKERVLKSWAIPKGISLDPKIKRLAVLTEDHPLDYLLFEGVIPEGSYGAGTVIVWDTGTYISDTELSEQFNKGKIIFTLLGQKLKGKFALIKTHFTKGKEGNQWLLIKSSDEFESKEDLTITRPESILTGRKNEDLLEDKKQNEEKRIKESFKRKEKNKIDFIDQKKSNNTLTDVSILPNQSQQNRFDEFPNKIKPMLSTLVDKPFDNKDWVFEIKWDGVRSILFFNKVKRTLEFRSRNDLLLTHRYPELVDALILSSTSSNTQLTIKCETSAILDGEIVVLDKKTGLPSFQNHQKRMNVDSERDIETLSKQIPATYYFFDILYIDGKNLQDLPFLERRKILSETIKENLRIKISDFIEEVGTEIFDKTKRMGLEGLIAKNKVGKYVQGTRSRDWLKIKHIKTQDCVVIGYTQGEGNRKDFFGSLLLAINYKDYKLKFVGHTGSGFNFQQLQQIYDKLQKIRIQKCPIEYVPYTNRKPFWVKPDLVVEIKFSDWTHDKIMRSPVFLRFREDKMPNECILEKEKYVNKVIENVKVESTETTSNDYYVIKESENKHSDPLFSNLDKIFWDKTKDHEALTKKDLIEYYEKISNHILPYLKDRPLSLSRYPDGVKGKSFYHKNWYQNNKPEYVQTVKVYSESRKDNMINYIICNNKKTLLWLANLGCIEMHPWYSRIKDFDDCKKRNDILFDEKCGLNFPDFIVFDLDPYIYSGKEITGQQEEPEYNFKAFQATVDVAYKLKKLFDELNIESYVKTSGKTGLHIFVPIVNLYTYDQTRSFAEIIGKLLSRRYPEKITMEWDITKRTNKVFFDYNQNARGKTLASIFSIRPTELATVSIPVRWEDLLNINPTDYTILNVPEILNNHIPNPWIDIMNKKQNLSQLLENVKEIF
jgi:bifunctional non-homologous end joining protein LigD